MTNHELKLLADKLVETALTLLRMAESLEARNPKPRPRPKVPKEN